MPNKCFDVCKLFQLLVCFTLLVDCNILFAQQAPKNLKRKIDSIVTLGIQQKAFPGAQVLIYKTGQLLVHQSYGYHTYDSIIPVANSHLYDLASVTKILAGTLAFMKLYETYNLDLDEAVSKRIPQLKNSNKSKTTYREVLSHSSGWIPYLSHQNTVFKKDKIRFKPRTVATKMNARFPLSIDDSLFVFKRYPKKIQRRIRKTPLENIGSYRYSGLWFFLLPDLVERLSGLPFEQFLKKEFYSPLGAERLDFLPRHRFPLNEIVPTEIDSTFRKKLVHGWVHDEAAAMTGGVSGNAGLFGNAASVLKLSLLLLKNGTYGDKQFFEPETLKQFTGRAYPFKNNRRGLGFDKPNLDTLAPYPSRLASPKSYGHSGFTGTLVWIDPEQECIFIFLSNRVYPSRNQRGIYDLNIRGQLLDYALQWDSTAPILY